MYNYGLTSFIQAKKLKSKECIDGFLKEDGITTFNYKNYKQVNEYIQHNWERFCSFVEIGSIWRKPIEKDYLEAREWIDKQLKYIENANI